MIMDKRLLDEGLLRSIELRATKRGITVDEYLSSTSTRYTLLDSGRPVLVGFNKTAYAVFESIEDAMKFREEYGKDTATILTEDALLDRMAEERKPIYTQEEAARLYGTRGTKESGLETVLLTY